MKRRGALFGVLALQVITVPLARAEGERGAVVASKAFTESVILGEIVSLVLGSVGLTVEHRRALGGTRLVWNALLAGEIDIYPEYTGTIVQEILAGAPDGADLARLGAMLQAKGVGVVGPLGFSNNYALGMRESVAARLGVSTISDLRRHAALRLGFSNEFMSRKDGWPAVRDRYELPQQSVTGLDHDLAYRGLARGALDVTELYSTDAEIRQYGLRVLVDDRRHFPRYEAVLLYRLSAAARAPELVQALARLEGQIDGAAMTAMNARVKLDRVDERAVAAELVSRRFAITGAVPGRGRTGPILRRTAEHLQLVGLSLLAAILAAVPLGILAARRRRFGQGVLAVVGAVQTIPSLALLVFMIPLLGIGALPAMVALFLYSLLPIVRNTHAGLSEIAPSVRESADALGLSPGAILWRIELPLASRTILAGIKSAAVINIGTATLGALVGAGGLGQPIFTGIRLDDVGLILEGAVPASILALAAQGVFEGIERVVVPRGLRVARGG